MAMNTRQREMEEAKKRIDRDKATGITPAKKTVLNNNKETSKAYVEDRPRRLEAKIGSPRKEDAQITYDDKKFNKRKKTKDGGNFEWDGSMLKGLPAKQYGKTYAAKFDSLANEAGIPNNQRGAFKDYLDAKEYRANPDANLDKATFENNRNVDRLMKKDEREKAQKVLESNKGQVKAQTKAMDKGFLQKALDFGKSLTAFDDANFKESRAKTGGDKEGAERFASRTANSVLLGLPAQLEKSVTGKVAPYQTARIFGDGKGTDTAADLLGYLVPGVGIAKGLRGTSLGAKGLGALAKQPLTKETAKQIAKQTAKEGASVGAIMSGTEITGREALNPEDYNWKQNLAQFGLETGAGAVLDPAVTLGLGKLLSKIKKSPTGNAPVEKSIQETLAELPPPPQRGPQPRDPGEPLQGLLEQLSARPVGKELAATTTKQRPGIEALMKAYKGQDVPSALSKQADNGMPKNAYESIVEAPVKKDEVLPVVKDVAKENKELYKDMAEDAIRNSDLWKDKSPIFLSRETLERNFEDIAGKDDGKKLKEYYIQPVRQKETERIRFVNDQRKTVESFGMKAKSKDDQLVQMYGEGKISLENLKKDTPNWEKVIEVSDWYKENYSMLIDTANKVLSETGEKTIPKRENYFPHYKGVDELFETLKKFGIDMENYSLPTGINGLTENFKPNKKFFANAMQRKTDETTFGAIEGFDRYIEGISQLIYHTENIKKLRALEGSLRNKYGESTHLTNLVVNLKEQGNLLAGKKAAADRYVEQHFGRKAYSVLDTIKQRTGLNMLGYNIGSASTAFIPLTHAAATTSKTAFAKGMMDTITNIVRKDGFADASGFLTRRVGSKPLVRSWWNKIENNSMGMMDLVDRFSSQTIVRGKYYELLEKGIPEKEALQQADDWAGRIMADRSKGQQPTLFASRTLGPIMQFQIEVNNQLSFLFKDIPKNAANKKELMSQMTQAVVYGYLANEVYEQVLGRRPSFDPIGVFMESYKNFSDSEMDKKEATTRTLKEVSNQLPFTSGLTGGGRFPITAALPSLNIDNYATGKTTVGDELFKPVKYLALPAGGGQIAKTYQANKILNERGVYKNDKLKYPVDDSPENVLKGLLLGNSSLPETGEYYKKPYNERRSPLTAKQTAEIDKSEDRKATFDRILREKKLKKLVERLDATTGKKEREELMKQINYLKGGK